MKDLTECKELPAGERPNRTYLSLFELLVELFIGLLPLGNGTGSVFNLSVLLILLSFSLFNPGLLQFRCLTAFLGFSALVRP